MDWRNKPKSFWREKLSDEQYKVTQEAGTEAPFTGAYWNEKAPGEYKCVCCGTELFNSTEKYDSGCGWPSFTAPKDGKAKASSLIEYKQDNSWFMTRTEVLCNNCGAHLGHVFDDGPTPEGQRYCINSAALNFEPNKKENKK